LTSAALGEDKEQEKIKEGLRTELGEEHSIARNQRMVSAKIRRYQQRVRWAVK